MNKIMLLFESYKGRDKVLRLLCYSSKYVAGSLKSPELASRFDKFSTQLSTSRACFRLLDDIPTLSDTLKSFNEKKEERSFLEITVNILGSITDLIFCPLDHISWALDHQILKSDNLFWDTASTACWVLSLYISIYKCIMKLFAISAAKLSLKSSSDPKKEALEKLTTQQWKLQLTVLKFFMDLLFAVNYLPKGVLWAKFFSKKGVGALGTISSLISLYQSML